MYACIKIEYMYDCMYVCAFYAAFQVGYNHESPRWPCSIQLKSSAATWVYVNALPSSPAARHALTCLTFDLTPKLTL